MTGNSMGNNMGNNMMGNGQNCPVCPSMPEGTGPEQELYRVQAGAYRNRTYAQRLMEELMDLDIPAYIDDSGPFYLVQVGEYTNLDEAAAMEQKIKRAGYPAVIVR